MEYRQEAQSWCHVAGALLQDELIHIEERVLVILVLLATPAVFIIIFLFTFTSDLQSIEFIYHMCNEVVPLQSYYSCSQFWV